MAGAPGPLGPTSQGERIDSIDTLRGVAVLGIFLMNIPTFALPSAAFFNPAIAGGFEGADFATWLVSHVLFDMKMMAIFSMLFGAGVVLMADRLVQTGRNPGAVHYRRMVWLLAIGLVHAYLIWFGDILVAYALIGMMVFPLRRLRPAWLVLIACILIPIGMVFSGLMQVMFEMMRDATDADMTQAWEQQRPMFFPTAEELDFERQKLMGGFIDRAIQQIPGVVVMQTVVFFMFTLWRVSGLMLLGMALHKLGVFKAERSFRFYTIMLALGVVLGGGLVVTGVGVNRANGYDPIAFFGVVGWFNYVGSVGVALAWVALVMLLCKSGVLGWPRRALAAVGQMALTNYLSQSVIAAFIFYGWGLGYFDQLSRSELALVVLGVWVLQLIVSPLWLSQFRFGPMEWLWRSLTYFKVEPIHREKATQP
ncbi:MAG: DUF418 domain-containing protein [Phycisphaerales bacterium JB064]